MLNNSHSTRENWSEHIIRVLNKPFDFRHPDFQKDGHERVLLSVQDAVAAQKKGRHTGLGAYPSHTDATGTTTTRTQMEFEAICKGCHAPSMLAWSGTPCYRCRQIETTIPVTKTHQEAVFTTNGLFLHESLNAFD